MFQLKFGIRVLIGKLKSALTRIARYGSFSERFVLCALMFLPIDLCFSSPHLRDSTASGKYAVVTARSVFDSFFIALVWHCVRLLLRKR